MKNILIIGFMLHITLSGCAPIPGHPKAILDVDKISDNYSKEVETLSNNPPKNCSGIIEKTNLTLTAIDLRYVEFITKINTDDRLFNTFSDIAITGLGLAGTGVTGIGAKTLFNALSSGLSASRISIDKNFFYEKAIPSLVSQMNADRKQQRSFIIANLDNCTDNQDMGKPNKKFYSWSEAVNDLVTYYEAGTLPNAISSIGSSANKRDAEMKCLKAASQIEDKASRTNATENCTSK